MSLFKNSFEKIINSLEEEMTKAFPDDFWSDITSRLNDYINFNL